MKNLSSFVLRFLLPPFYAALGFTFFAVMFDPSGFALSTAAAMLGLFALYAYLFAGIPALLFAIVMRVVDRKYGPGNGLVSATLLGGFSGVVIGAFLGLAGLALFASVGLVVGYLVEGTVILLARRAFRARGT